MEVRPRQNAFFDRGLTATNYGCLQGDGINRDPLGEAGGLNLYGFVGNNPVNRIDPDGELAFIVALGITIAVDWAYDRYIDPYVQDYIDEHFDCLTQQRLATVGAGINLARSLKNPLKGLRNLRNFGAATKRTKRGGRFTEPDLPPKTIVDENGVKLQHYTRSGDHAPAHVHVKGGGPDTRIGQNLKPISKNDPNPTPKQRNILNENKSIIRKSIDQIQRFFNFENLD